MSVNSGPGAGIHILNGHFLSRDDTAPADIFESQLSMLQSYGVHFIDFQQAVDRIHSRNISDDVCCVAFSFDDGFEECYSKIRPVLNARGIKAGFFINPNFVSGDQQYREYFKRIVVRANKDPMSWDQIGVLANEGHIIGAHTMDHVRLNNLDRKTLEYQIVESKVRIQTRIGSNCQYFAYPFGKLKHITKEGLEIAEKHYSYIFSQSNYRNYFSFDGKVLNRRHFECDWPFKHVIYFLKSKTLN